MVIEELKGRLLRRFPDRYGHTLSASVRINSNWNIDTKKESRTDMSETVDIKLACMSLMWGGNLSNEEMAAWIDDVSMADYAGVATFERELNFDSLNKPILLSE